MKPVYIFGYAVYLYEFQKPTFMHPGFYTLFKRVTVIRKIIPLTCNLYVIFFYEIISIDCKCSVFVKTIQTRNIRTVKHLVDNSCGIKLRKIFMLFFYQYYFV